MIRGRRAPEPRKRGDWYGEGSDQWYGDGFKDPVWRKSGFSFPRTWRSWRLARYLWPRRRISITFATICAVLALTLITRVFVPELGERYRPLAAAAAETEPYGVLHKCTIRGDGSLWCMGANSEGQLGVGDIRDRSAAVRVGTARWLTVAVGVWHTCAIRTDQTLWCWGADFEGALGTEPFPRPLAGSDSPQQVFGGGRWLMVATVDQFTCGLRTDHTLWCWGVPGLDPTEPPTSALPRQYGHARDWLTLDEIGGDLCVGHGGPEPAYCWGLF